MALRSKPSRGYTLLELFVVIAVIGILFAAAIPLYERYREKAPDTASSSWPTTPKSGPVPTTLVR